MEMTMRVASTKAALLFPLVLLLGASATQSDARESYDPGTQTQQHAGSSVDRTTKDLVVIRRGPDYPARSRLFREEGTVSLNVWLSEDGTVSSTAIERSSGFERLDDAAVRFMKDTWRYKWFKKETPMPTLVRAEVMFKLD
jgi:TonB family protein